MDADNLFLSAKGIGVDPANGQPWVVGPFDSDDDGSRDAFHARRFAPASGAESLGFIMDSQHGTIVDVEGIGIDPNSSEPWIAVQLDTDSDTFGDRWGIQKYDLALGDPVVDVLIDSRFTVDPLPTGADFDGDGLVTGLDFLIWQRNFPLTGTGMKATGDANDDTNVDGADVVVWGNQFGAPPPASPASKSAVATVPEPSSCWMLSLGLPFLAQRPRLRLLGQLRPRFASLQTG